MNYLKNITRILIIAISLTLTFVAESGTKSVIELKSVSAADTVLEEYTYVRVLIDNVWWIYVYNSDGVLVNRYIEEQD